MFFREVGIVVVLSLDSGIGKCKRDFLTLMTENWKLC